MTEVHDHEGPKLAIALRNWIGLHSIEIAQIINRHWKAYPNRRPDMQNLVRSGLASTDGRLTEDGVKASLDGWRLSPLGSLGRIAWETVLDQWYWRRYAAMVYCRYPLKTYRKPLGRSYLNGEIIGPDPADRAGENTFLWDEVRLGPHGKYE